MALDALSLVERTTLDWVDATLLARGQVTVCGFWAAARPRAHNPNGSHLLPPRQGAGFTPRRPKSTRIDSAMAC